MIDGPLRSKIEGANFYLLNPSGVLFGPDASLDVSGSFHVSTADFLRFAEKAKFSFNLGQESVLTVASPMAFGFLGNDPALMTIQGSKAQVRDGEAFSVVGSDLTILGNNGPLTDDSIPIVSAPSGRIQLASVASPGEVVFSRPELTPDLQVDGFARLGQIELSQSALVNASGNGGGTILLRSGGLRVDQSRLFADNTGRVDGAGMGLDLGIRADAVIRNGALLITDSLGAGQARDLRLTAGRVQIHNSLIAPRPFASGDGGNVSVHVGRLTLAGGAAISSTRRGSGGRGGQLTVAASDTIAIAGRDQKGNPSGLFSNTQGDGSGGNVHVTARHLQLSDGGAISARSTGEGAAGTLLLEVDETFRSENARVTTSAERAGGAPSR